jgi:UDP-N-acetylglucosamine 2-epimerase (non-hydrolysing)
VTVRRIMVVFGTRPEAIKVAPLIHRLQDDPRVRTLPVTTAQHRFMLDQVLDLFGIEPVADLDIMRHGATLAEVTGRALDGLDKVIAEQTPDAVVVHGDATTAMVGALAAFYRRVPVVHLEAGLRTGDLTSPYPEEANRRLVAQLAALHLAPTDSAAANLIREGAPAQRVVVTGNTVIDALEQAVARHPTYDEPLLKSLDDDPRPVLLVTAHRRESWGLPMREVGRALAELAEHGPGVHIVLPIHRNPVVRDALLPPLDGFGNVTVTEPLGYADFCRLMSRSHVVLTDSGGVQEEAPSLGKPVLVMRDTTERPEGIAAGTARLVGTDRDRIVSEVRRLLVDRTAYRRMARAVSPYGDGRASERAAAALLHLFGDGPQVVPFRAPSEVPAQGHRMVGEWPDGALQRRLAS